MSEQTKFEVIKALAYGEEPQKIADVEDIKVATVLEIQRTCADDIAEEQEDLRKAGYIS